MILSPVELLSLWGFVQMCIRDRVVSERILILDGAMGTMIQQYNLKEEDFRGGRFAHIPGPVSYTHLDVYKRQELSV